MEDFVGLAGKSELGTGNQVQRLIRGRFHVCFLVALPVILADLSLRTKYCCPRNRDYLHGPVVPLILFGSFISYDKGRALRYS